MNTTGFIEKRKREDTDFINEDDRDKIQNIGQHLSKNTSFLMNIPNEILNMILEKLNRKELINLSCINREHRGLLYYEIFKNIQFKWKDIKFFLENFKQLNNVESVLILCDLKNEKETNHGEWNVSFKKLFERCLNLNEMYIELITSGRCLKYKDDFDVELSNKIIKITLESQSHCNSGDVNDNAMFELTQLQRFHKIKELTLKRFSIAKDIYFYPKIKEDMSDFEKRRNDGKLIELKDINLVNCAWEYPINLKEVFSPDYPIPGLNSFNVNKQKNCKPKKLGLYYSGDYIKFTGCERFKSFINNEYNEKFLYEIEFFEELKELELVILNDKNRENEFTCYYPWIDMINLRREYYIEDLNSNKFIKKTILGNLEKLVLVGWRSSSIQDLDKCFKISKEKDEENYLQLRHMELYLMRNNNYQSSNIEIKDNELRRLSEYKERLQILFGNGCHVTVGYVDECIKDKRYEAMFGEQFVI